MSHVFLDCGDKPLGLYPIVDNSQWIARLLPLGVTTIQLRIKNVKDSVVSQEIKTAVELSEKYNARLFINDYWQLAIEHHAYGVHLGQDDLDTCDINAIAEAGLRLGISTHNWEETERALKIQPSYVAFGAIYPTFSKVMSLPPQGLDRLRTWCKMVDYPKVAIGGININNIRDILACNVSGVALISAITMADDPEAVTKKLLQEIECYAN